MANLSPRRPAQANLRRALSTAYYALFHCLAASAADLLIGKKRGPAWRRTYRALDHGGARRACLGARSIPEYSAAVRSFAKDFVGFQRMRQGADYAIDGKLYYKSDVIAAIDNAESAIERFGQANVEERRAFVAQALFRGRR